MPPVLSARRQRIVRHKQTVDYDGLRREAVEALAKSGRSQADVARAIGVKPPTLNAALRDDESPARYASTLARVIAEVSDYTVADETKPTYRLLRKGTEG